ncbi:VOC family protein [Streptomyces sp. MJP52]|uniref:VOC family protein n=1 Tax=Streptomyces sp. MJP52 TaxID=2940555 RepID=UPI00247572E4|nr:VOC family protein [Streptomyces sp. MJP52]MDH6224016.1 catechol 2,3-dioxygenase-like lactoylglutathione lyase family enzyme [Streptomyces sp. MJP52]
MTSHLHALTFDALDPTALALFWAGLLGRTIGEDTGDGVTVLPGSGTELPLRFVRTREPKTSQNRLHFDLTSASLDEQKETVARALGLGGRHTDVGQLPQEEHVVLADPDGNEFCVIEPGNGFLAGCGFVGALACDGSQAVGYFWSRALGWPLVWDENEETAIQSPAGGTKITWGGPPLMPRLGRDRIRFDLAVGAGDGLEAEIERLLSLGATRPDGGGRDDSGRVVLNDPDGNEFTVRTAR